MNKRKTKTTKFQTPLQNEEIVNAAMGAVVGGIIGGPAGVIVGGLAGTMIEVPPDKRKSATPVSKTSVKKTKHSSGQSQKSIPRKKLAQREPKSKRKPHN